MGKQHGLEFIWGLFGGGVIVFLVAGYLGTGLLDIADTIWIRNGIVHA